MNSRVSKSNLVGVVIVSARYSMFVKQMLSAGSLSGWNYVDRNCGIKGRMQDTELER